MSADGRGRSGPCRDLRSRPSLDSEVRWKELGGGSPKAGLALRSLPVSGLAFPICTMKLLLYSLGRPRGILPSPVLVGLCIRVSSCKFTAS